jgi:hypothetical protein
MTAIVLAVSSYVMMWSLAPQAAGGPDAAAMEEFGRRAAEYEALHEQVEATTPAFQLTDDGGAILATEHAFATKLQNARRGAERGMILTEPIGGFLRRQIAGAVAAPGGDALRAAILEEIEDEIKELNPRLRINGPWPSGLAYSTVPTQILDVLPPLPDSLEYRFVGHDLVLRDIHANIVVDYMEQALP